MGREAFELFLEEKLEAARRAGEESFRTA